MARLTGLEPATPGVTGRYSNQLSYNRPLRSGVLWRSAAAVKRGFAPNGPNLQMRHLGCWKEKGYGRVCR